MARFEAFKDKIPLILVVGILILIACFVIISCGTDPQLKVQDPDKGQYAVDFSACPGDYCSILLPISEENAPELPIDGRPLTVEAWVKAKSTSTTGYITGRINAEGGTTLLVQNNIPKFSIRHEVPNATSTDQIVASDPAFSLVKDIWTHIAGVLSDTEHDDVNDHNEVLSTCAAGVGTETPHLDIYVNGTFAGCASTLSNFSSSPGTESEGIGVNGESGVDVAGVSAQTNFNGIIDEVRLFNIEKTAAQINACMNTELGLSGECKSTDSGLVGYTRLNEGEGTSTGDGAGIGSGIKEEFEVDVTTTRSEWGGGWTLDAAPITRAD